MKAKNGISGTVGVEGGVAVAVGFEVDVLVGVGCVVGVRVGAAVGVDVASAVWAPSSSRKLSVPPVPNEAVEPATM